MNENTKLNKRISLTEDENITLDRHDGVLPTGGLLVKVYCHNMEKGKELKQQILNNQAIVEGLHSFISHCDEMIMSYDSQLLVSTDSKHGEFLMSQSEEWNRKKNDLTELIEYRTTKHSEGLERHEK